MHKAASAEHKAREPMARGSAARSRRGAACVRIAGADGSPGCALARAVAVAGSCACVAVWAGEADFVACEAAHILLLGGREFFTHRTLTRMISMT